MYEIQSGKGVTPSTPRKFWSTTGVEWSIAGVGAEKSGVSVE